MHFSSSTLSYIPHVTSTNLQFRRFHLFSDGQILVAHVAELHGGGGGPGDGIPLLADSVLSVLQRVDARGVVLVLSVRLVVDRVGGRVDHCGLPEVTVLRSLHYSKRGT